AADLVDDGAEQGADGDGCADKGDVGDVGRAVRAAQQSGCRRNISGTSDEGDDIAALQLGVGQNGNFDPGGTAGDLAQEHAAHLRQPSEFGQRLSVDRFAGDVDIQALDGHRE